MALATAELAGRLLLCLRADGATYKYPAGWLVGCAPPPVVRSPPGAAPAREQVARRSCAGHKFPRGLVRCSLMQQIGDAR